MDLNKALLAPCGLYCGVCSILIAHRDENEKFKKRLSSFYGVEPEQIRCEGCLADEGEVFTYCRICPIKACAQDREIDGCHQCHDFPCQHIDQFPIPVGKKVILRSVPLRREWGDARWVQEEKARYECPHCGYALFRGAKRCRQCREPVDVD